MKEYYLKNGNRVKGPFLLDDLKRQEIGPNTMVRTNQSNDWTPISEDGDLSFLIRIQSEYTYTGHNEANVSQSHEGNKPKMSIVVIAILLLVLGIGMAVFVFLGSAPR